MSIRVYSDVWWKPYPLLISHRSFHIMRSSSQSYHFCRECDQASMSVLCGLFFLICWSRIIWCNNRLLNDRIITHLYFLHLYLYWHIVMTIFPHKESSNAGLICGQSFFPSMKLAPWATTPCLITPHPLIIFLNFMCKDWNGRKHKYRDTRFNVENPEREKPRESTNS